MVPGLRQMTGAVHEQGGRIILQLAHAGGFARSKLTGQTPLAPSALEGFSKILPKEMTPEDIREVTEAFGLAAQRAKAAGFDGMQIHAAHGYLSSQFLSSFYNKRLDDYGGTVENRYRVLGQVLKKVRATVGAHFPVLIKLNSQDFLEGGLRLEDSVKIGGWLQEDGIDAIELSGGTFKSGTLSPSRSDISTEEQEAYFADGAKAFKEKVTVPTPAGGRYPFLAGGGTDHRTGNRRLYLDEPAVHSGAGTHPALAVRRPSPGLLPVR